MAIDPAYALQVAVVSLIKADAGFQALQPLPGVHDLVPTNPVFPYLTVDEADVHPEVANLGELSETWINVHVWARAAGAVQCKQIGDVLRTAFTLTKLAPAGHQLVSQLPQRFRTMRDPDGLTTHGVLTVRVLTAPLPPA